MSAKKHRKSRSSVLIPTLHQLGCQCIACSSRETPYSTEFAVSVVGLAMIAVLGGMMLWRVGALVEQKNRMIELRAGVYHSFRDSRNPVAIQTCGKFYSRPDGAECRDCKDSAGKFSECGVQNK